VGALAAGLPRIAVCKVVLYPDYLALSFSSSFFSCFPSRLLSPPQLTFSDVLSFPVQHRVRFVYADDAFLASRRAPASREASCRENRCAAAAAYPLTALSQTDTAIALWVLVVAVATAFFTFAPQRVSPRRHN
jgi:hypothetical protein